VAEGVLAEMKDLASMHSAWASIIAPIFARVGA
jgi:hypothetical protein